jgi:organic hydroperoxide reductase OsmC/OhrA
MKNHSYALDLRWTGNTGSGTASYRGFERSHELSAPGKAPIAGSSDPAFRGDPTCWNPEELLVASLSQCHMLWYLHLCAMAKVVVTAYEDHPTGTMTEMDDGAGQFSEVTLHPVVAVASAEMVEAATALHQEVHKYCFIARSVWFPVTVSCSVRVG